ncbi:MAG: M48 family metalloprotease [archaeon GB-1845-036]|nr:M48 family metalloprotease [Candidatus Culexmicrobium thermophilum]
MKNFHYEKSYELGFYISREDYEKYFSFIEGKCLEWFSNSVDSINLLHEKDRCILQISFNFPINFTINLNLDEQLKMTIRSCEKLSTEYVLNLVILFQYFTHQFVSSRREGNVILVYIPGLPITPMKEFSPVKKFLNALFTGSFTAFFFSFLLIGLLFFSFMGSLAPLGIIGFQTVLFLLSSRIISFIGDWQLSYDHGDVYIVSCRIPILQFTGLVKRKWTDIMSIKKEIYDASLGLGKSLSSKLISEKFREHGIICPETRIQVKHIRLYDLIKDLCEKYSIEVPRINVLNTIVPNAASSGPSLKFATLLVNSGLIYMLNEDEVKAVIGHELSHTVNRDPLVLFAMASCEYLLRVYVLQYLTWPLDLIYLLVSVSSLYFMAKFLEARADLEASYRLKSPSALVNALLKLSFPRTFYERSAFNRFLRWFSWNPHPPTYFRILRLEQIDISKKPKSFLLESIKDCLRGFVHSFI